MKYKILIKYTSVLKKEFYYFYINEETGEEYYTDDVIELNKIIKKLDEKFGYENIKVVIDASYDINVNVTYDGGYNIVTEKEVESIYKTAYREVFGDDNK